MSWRLVSQARRRWHRGLVVSTILTLMTFGVAIDRAAAQAPSAPGQRPPAAVAPGELTIAGAIQEAIEHNLGLLARRADVTVADAQVITAKLRPNPVLSLDADHLDWLGTGFNDTNNGGPTELAARVDVPIERGDKRDLRIDSARAVRAVAEAKVDDAVRTLSETVALACIDVVQAQDNLTLAQEALHNFEELATFNDERVRAGATSPYEAARSRVAMLQFRATVSHAELEVRSASLRLQQALGRPLSDDVVHVTAPPANIPQSFPELTALETVALEHRPDVRADRLTQAQSVSDLRLQLALGKVDFTLGSEYRRQAGPIGESNSLGFFFSAPLPFSNRNQGEIARAGAQGMQAGRETAALEAEVRTEVRTALDTYRTTSILVKSIEDDLLESARTARDIAAYAYRAGGTTLIDLIDSERAWNDAMQSYRDAQAERRRAAARLNSAVGSEVIP
jgi:cobalt-zinc-cadmium efflux system outer membrane protein